LSKDIAQRVIPIKLTRPRSKPGWEGEVRAFCRSHRPAILGDVRDILQSAPGPINPRIRQTDWAKHILAKLPDYLEVEDLIKTRQKAMDDDQTEKYLIIDFFREKLEKLGHDSLRDKVLIPSVVAAEWVSEATRERYATNRASAFLKGMAIPMLSK